jgi:hypothetical protein
MNSFEVGRFLAALPRQDLREPSPEVALSVSWPRIYPTLKAYNGFSSLERAKMGAAAKWLWKVGALTLLDACEVCGSSNRLGHHSENYADPRNAITLCQPCHFALHRRFSQPDGWARRSELAGAQSWITQLPVNRQDIRSMMEAAGVSTALEVHLPDWCISRMLDRRSALCNR